MDDKRVRRVSMVVLVLIILAAGFTFFSDTAFSNKITGFASKEKCDNKPVNEYLCKEENLQRKYQFSDCSTDWVFVEECDFGCSDGQCQPMPVNDIICSSDDDCGQQEGCNFRICKNPGTKESFCANRELIKCQDNDGCCPAVCGMERDNDCTESDIIAEHCYGLSRLECKTRKECFEKFERKFFNTISAFDKCVGHRCEILGRVECHKDPDCEMILDKKLGIFYFFDECIKK